MNLLPWKQRSLRAVALIALIAPALMPVHAQTGSDTEIRLRKVESEVAALQRVVFPGTGGKFFPQLQSGQSGSVQPGSPASSTSSDMLVRMDALEGQVARLTAQVEEDHNRVEKIEARLAVIESAGSARVQTVTDAPTTTTSTDSNLAAMGAARKPVPVAAKPAPKPAPKPSADAAAKRVAAVRAVVKPSTRDAGDDEYSYGYRLWEAKFFPESEQQLKMFLQKYPRHARTSYARNLLGRDYLDDGNAHEAAGWFLQNYKLEPKGDRAPDSLLYLAESMRQLGDTTRGCVAVKQFAATFPAEAAGRLQSQYSATSSGLKCK